MSAFGSSFCSACLRLVICSACLRHDKDAAGRADRGLIFASPSLCADAHGRRAWSWIVTIVLEAMSRRLVMVRHWLCGNANRQIQAPHDVRANADGSAPGECGPLNAMD